MSSTDSVFSQGVSGLQRAVIQVNASTQRKDLLVEGEGLREVMTTDGALAAFHCLIALC